MPADTYEKIVRMLQKSGVPCVLDADDQSLELGIRAKPFMIKPNEFEISRLMNRRFKDIGDYAGAAQMLVKDGIQIVVVSLGAKGAIFVTATEVFHATAPTVQVRSKIGAGDSLIGGFLWGLTRKLSLRESAKIGIAASSSAVMREADRLCLKEDIPRLSRRVRIKNL